MCLSSGFPAPVRASKRSTVPDLHLATPFVTRQSGDAVACQIQSAVRCVDSTHCAPEDPTRVGGNLNLRRWPSPGGSPTRMSSKFPGRTVAPSFCSNRDRRNLNPSKDVTINRSHESMVPPQQTSRSAESRARGAVPIPYSVHLTPILLSCGLRAMGSPQNRQDTDTVAPATYGGPAAERSSVRSPHCPASLRRYLSVRGEASLE